MQLIKLLQVFGKLIRFYSGAVGNVLFLVHTLMHGVGKGSIANVFEIWQVLQVHGIQSKIVKKCLLLLTCSSKTCTSRKRAGIPWAHSWLTGAVPAEDGHSLGSWIENLWTWKFDRHDSR
ncbi:hypothetical protein TNCV_4877151 [Trichonephila clavipes]|nr:hypothetical protein TNCV_4877151 [Trichonephila clavipes]